MAQFKQKFQRLLAYFIPFLAMGIALVLLVIGIVIVSYILLWGALVGLIIFLISFIRMKFFSKKSSRSLARKGNVFDHDEFK